MRWKPNAANLRYPLFLLENITASTHCWTSGWNKGGKLEVHFVW